MDKKVPKKAEKASRFLLSFASFIVVIAGIKLASGFIVPILLAVFFAIICLPLFHFFCKKGLPSWLALVIVFLLIVVIIGTVGVLIGSSVQGFSSNLPAYQEKLFTLAERSFTLATKLGIKLPEEKLLKLFNPGVVIKYIATSLKSFGNVMSNGFFIILFVIFVLLESATFSKKLARIAKTPETINYFETLFTDVTRYMALKTITSLATGLFVSLLLLGLGVDFAFLWGLAAFLLNYIPTIGSIIAAIPALLMALIQFGVGKTIIVAVGYAVINVIIGNIVEPKLMGTKLGLSTLIVFMSLIFWGWVFGPVGMFLSVPLTMVVKIALDSQEETRWIAVMLSKDVENT